MKTVFDVKEIDRTRYETLRDFLPEKIIDIHTHVWLDEFRSHNNTRDPRVASWPQKVATDNSINDLLDTYQLLFPGKQCTPLIFSIVEPGDNIEQANAYVSGCAGKHQLPALIFAQPHWPATELERKIIGGGFLGAKVYLSHAAASIQKNDITIFDFLPRHQLELLNQHGLIAMLHIPREGRLKDPLNLEQMIKIENLYPDVKLIIAHVGRAYCNEDIGNAFEVLKDTESMLFDISANTNQYVFEQLIKSVGPQRILFGSDLPITRMRMRRICEDGKYINLVPKGLYGDVSDDKHMRELDYEESRNLTFFIYEEIDAFRQASIACGLTPHDITDIFYSNALNIIKAVRG